MEDKSQEQSNNRPWLFKKGQPSANPGGRPKGSISLKEYARKYLREMTEEEKLDFIEGINKLDIWKLAEGNPDNKSELKVDSMDGFTPEELIEAKKILVNRIKSNSTTTGSGEATVSEPVGPTQED